MEVPFVALFDFFGDDSVTGDPVEKEAAQESNRDFWAQLHHLFSDEKRLGIFIGELEDIPDESLGPDLPERRGYAKEVFEFVGYTLQFDPIAHTDRAKIRTELGYGEETLVICSIGGTSVGRDLLTLCAQAYPLVGQSVPCLRMILVCGPRLGPGSLSVPPGVEVRGYIPSLYKHFAASDLAIVQGGGTTTLELTALRRPFLYFPLEGHYEQQVHVAHRLRRHRAGIELSYSRTTAASLANAIVANLGKGVDYAPIATDGAQRSAQLITQLM